jgi:diacylglycerol kinase family enzyme
VAEIRQVLSTAGFEVRVTSELDQLREWSAAACNEGTLRSVVSVGGDGTASLVRSHVPLAVPLLALPLGTENLLARYLAQSADPSDVLRTLTDGVTIELDLGLAGGRVFLLMISAGFDAEVIRRLHEDRTGNITRRSYVLPTLRTIRNFEYPELHLSFEGLNNPSATCRWVFGFNLPLYALGLPIAPEAVATDGLLDVCTFGQGDVPNVARYLWYVARRRHFSLPDTALTRCRRFRLESDVPGVAYQIDGDFGGLLPVDVEVLAGQLRLIVSRETAQRLGFALEGDGATIAAAGRHHR